MFGTCLLFGANGITLNPDPLIGGRRLRKERAYRISWRPDRAGCHTGVSSPIQSALVLRAITSQKRAVGVYAARNILREVLCGVFVLAKQEE